MTRTLGSVRGAAGNGGPYRDRRPRIPVPLLTPWLSSHWIGLITPVDAGVARPLIEGLSTDTTVTDPSGMALFDFQPRSFKQALSEAIVEENGSVQRAPS